MIQQVRCLSSLPDICQLPAQDIMAREQQMLVEELGQFLSRLEGHPVSTADAMALTIQQLMDTAFPVTLC